MSYNLRLRILHWYIKGGARTLPWFINLLLFMLLPPKCLILSANWAAVAITDAKSILLTKFPKIFQKPLDKLFPKC